MVLVNIINETVSHEYYAVAMLNKDLRAFHAYVYDYSFDS